MKLYYSAGACSLAADAWVWLALLIWDEDVAVWAAEWDRDWTAAWMGRDVFAATHFGGYSDVLCVPETLVFDRPADMSGVEGAALP